MRFALLSLLAACALLLPRQGTALHCMTSNGGQEAFNQSCVLVIWSHTKTWMPMINDGKGVKYMLDGGKMFEDKRDGVVEKDYCAMQESMEKPRPFSAKENADVAVFKTYPNEILMYHCCKSDFCNKIKDDEDDVVLSEQLQLNIEKQLPVFQGSSITASLKKALEHCWNDVCIGEDMCTEFDTGTTENVIGDGKKIEDPQSFSGGYSNGTDGKVTEGCEACGDATMIVVGVSAAGGIGGLVVGAILAGFLTVYMKTRGQTEIVQDDEGLQVATEKDVESVTGGGTVADVKKK